MTTIIPGSSLALVGGRLCLDFCNTVEYHDTDQHIDLLKKGYPSLVWWSEALKLIEPDRAEQLMETDDERTRVTLEQALKLREALYQIFVAGIAKATPPADSLRILNDAVQDATHHHHLTVQDSGGLVWQWQDQDSPMAMLWPIALSAVDLLTSDELDRVRQCPGCGWLFFDQSRNHSRTWCDMQFCGNRSKARRFYQKQKFTE